MTRDPLHETGRRALFQGAGEAVSQQAQELLVGWTGQLLGGEQGRLQRGLDQTPEYDGGGPDGVMPVDVPKHLVFREQEGLQGGNPLLGDRDLRRGPIGLARQGQRVEKPFDIHRPVGDAAEEAVASQIVDLVQIQRAGHEPLQRVCRRPANHFRDVLAGGRPVHGQGSTDGLGVQEPRRDVLVVSGDRLRSQLLHRMRERVVPDVVEQRRQANDRDPGALLVG